MIMKKMFFSLFCAACVFTANAGEGALKGYFSVNSSGDKIAFSKGNLQYQASTNKWQFAEHQYDVLGTEANNAISSTNAEWIDLFGWGTSGVSNKYPYMTSTTATDYGNGENNIANTQYDWGSYDAIINGGNLAGKWRTLTKEEWQYMFEDRMSALRLRGQATVNGIHGYVVLPDNFLEPIGITWKGNPNNWTDNTLTLEQWGKMEDAGAVFLPVADHREGVVTYDGDYGYYWTSSYDASKKAYCIFFEGTSASITSDMRYRGQSVRLVQAYEVPTAITEIHSNKSQSQKVFRDGQLLIERDGKTYTIMGQNVR